MAQNINENYDKQIQYQIQQIAQHQSSQQQKLNKKTFIFGYFVEKKR